MMYAPMQNGEVWDVEQDVTVRENATSNRASDSVADEMDLRDAGHGILQAPISRGETGDRLLGPITHGEYPEWMRVRVDHFERRVIKKDSHGGFVWADYAAVEMGECAFTRADLGPSPSGLRTFRVVWCNGCDAEYLTGFRERDRRPGLCKACYDKRRTDRHEARIEEQRQRRNVERIAKLVHECAHCHERMQPARITRKYCSSSCRVAALRARRAPESLPDSRAQA